MGAEPAFQFNTASITASYSSDRVVKCKGGDIAVDSALRNTERVSEVSHSGMPYLVKDIDDGVAPLVHIQAHSPPITRSMLGSVTVKLEAALRNKKSFGDDF